MYNWNRCLLLVSDDAIRTRHLPPFEQVQQVPDILLANTQRMMQLVDQYCRINVGDKLPNIEQQDKKDLARGIEPREDSKDLPDSAGTRGWTNGRR